MKQRCRLGLQCLSLLVLVACATTPKTPARPLTGDPLVDGPYALAEGPSRDRILWQYRMAGAALQQGEVDLARVQLDEALARIGNIFTADPESRRARGYFKKEAKKTFLGEPYERAMAYFYRGIIYWMDGEPDNARACFRSGQFHDADAEDKTYAGDYVLFDYLDGLASAKLGGDGTDALKRAQEVTQLAIPPDPRVDDNVLFFVDYGHGPTKFADGQYGEQLRFERGFSAAHEVMIRVGDQAAHVGPYDDLNFQATTRGGRVMDHVLGNQAVFKSTTDTLGTAALISGGILATDSSTEGVGIGLLVAGLASKIIAASTRPEADTRCWDNLPLFLTFATLELPAGTHTATVEFLDAQRHAIPNLTKTVTFHVPPERRDTVIYVSDKSVTPLDL